MKVTVKYIPISLIKTEGPFVMTEKLRRLRRAMNDCMHLLVVRKMSRGGYRVVFGLERLDFLLNHTNKKKVPCLVDESRAPVADKFPFWRRSVRHRIWKEVPELIRERLVPASWSIVKAFMLQEPRFNRLSSAQKLRVLLLAIRYQKTVIAAMKAKVDRWAN